MAKTPGSPQVRQLQKLRSQLTGLIAKQREMERNARVANVGTVLRHARARDRVWRETAKLFTKVLVDGFTAAEPQYAREPRDGSAEGGGT